MDKNKDIQFERKSASIYLALSTVKWGSWKFLAATTAVLFGGSGYSYAVDRFPGYEFYATIFAVLLGWMAIDYGLGGLISYYYDHREKSEEEQNDYKVKLLKALLIFIIIRYLATVTISLWSSGEVAENITKQQDPMSFIAALEYQDSSHAAKIQDSKTYRADLIKTEGKRVRDAKKKGHEAIQNAILSGDKWQRINYQNSRFSWLENRRNKDKKDHNYAAIIRKAIADSILWVDVEYERTRNAEDILTATLSDTATTAIKDSISTWAAQSRQLFLERKERRTTLFIIADIGFGVIGWFCEYLLSLMRKAGVTVRRRRTFAYVMRNILASWAEFILALLEKLVVRDLDGDGVVGTVGGKTPALPGKKGWFSSLFSPTTTTTATTGATASATPATVEPTTAGASVDLRPATATTATGATAEQRAIVKGFLQEIPVTTEETTIPAAPVPTGVSAGSGRAATTATPATTKEIITKVIHGVGYVIHNGQRRDESWVKKQLRAYKTRRKQYLAKRSDATVVDANIQLFETYLKEIEKLTQAT